MAWKEFAMAEDPDWFAGNYEYQVPIFVLTDMPPKKCPKETDKLTFTFVTDGIVRLILSRYFSIKAFGHLNMLMKTLSSKRLESSKLGKERHCSL